MSAPPAEAIAAILGPSSRVTRRIDIYEEDGETLFMSNAGIMGGSISVDISREERRTIDLELENVDGSLDNYPGGFWYDKIIKPYRGVSWDGLTKSWLSLDGTGSTFAYIPNSSVFALQSNRITLIAEVETSVWPVAASSAIAAKWGSSGNFSWRCYFDTSGRIIFSYSTTGSNSVNLTSTAFPSKPRFVKVDFYSNNGSGGKTAYFSYSEDGVGWTEFSSATSGTGGTTALFTSTAPLVIGASSNTSTGTGSLRLNGKVYSVQLWDDARLMVEGNFKCLHYGNLSHIDPLTGLAFSFRGNAIIDGGLWQEQYWETQLGEFMIDRITTQDFPNTVRVTGRDYTKKLLEDQFQFATTFVTDTPVHEVIQAIALNGGITKYIIPPGPSTLGRDFTFEAQTERWTAMNEIAKAYNLELYFNAEGYLVMREFQDPVSSPIRFTFETGEFGNLVSIEKSAHDSRMYNVVVVRSESSDSIPFTGVAENHEPTSPTSIENLGRRKVYNYTSSFITTLEQAETVALNLLKTRSLESFEISLEAIVIPWLEGGDVVEFIDPDPNPGDPSRFLSAGFDVPLGLGSMTMTGKRVTVVG